MSVVVLESNHSLHDEPTVGVTVADDFCYVANGQWGKMSDVLAGEGAATAPVVLRLPVAD